MPANDQKTLSEFVEIARQFQRSVRIDIDFGRPDALQGYICQATARTVLDNMANQIAESSQRAFTWTGPFGGGKSSLAIVLASLVSGDAALRSEAKKRLGLTAADKLAKVFRATDAGWLVIPVVGSRTSAQAALAEGIATRTRANPSTKQNGRLVIETLVRLAASRKDQGVLVIIDELGKCLEAAAHNGDDVHFLQELAEAASRAQGKLVVVGILHQAFDAYANRLPKNVRDEWAKVQGRFIDIPLVSATDEVVELIGQAILLKEDGLVPKFVPALAHKVADAIKRRRPASPPSLGDALSRCWPLHPATASILGPVSKRAFGQNERSIFGFLASREPLGFIEYLQSASNLSGAGYSPSMYWDYLRANLEPAILASPDGHRWASAVDAVERAEAKGMPQHVELTKTIALIDLFRNGSGIAADREVLSTCFSGQSNTEVDEALEFLARISVVIFKKHVDAWAIYDGSDFDVDAAFKAARQESSDIDFKRIASLCDLHPVVAKRLYHETGTMRWFEKNIVRFDALSQHLTQQAATHDAVGEFCLILPDLTTGKRSIEAKLETLSANEIGRPMLLGLPQNSRQIVELAADLLALEKVLETRNELSGDNVAKRELDARAMTTQALLQEELRNAFHQAVWFYRGKRMPLLDAYGLSSLASQICTGIFDKAPSLRNELVNRQAPSSNAVKARRDLLYRMLSNETLEGLGLSGYPPEAGLYVSLLKSTGLHRKTKSGAWEFKGPTATGPGASIAPLWVDTSEFIGKSSKDTSLAALYEAWGKPPYGVRLGVMPILAMAFVLAHRQRIAMFLDGVFTPELSEAAIDQWLQSPETVHFRFVGMEKSKQDMLGDFATHLSKGQARSVSAQPLDVARALVAIALDLPHWTKRTNSVPKDVQEVRQLLLRASDPHKLLFTDLPSILDLRKENEIRVKVFSILTTLEKAYEKMLRGVEAHLFSVLDHSGATVSLNSRADTVAGVTGEFQVDAFATRLKTYAGTTADIEGLISLAVSKPSSQWVDHDVDASVLQISQWAHQFRQAEAFANISGRAPSRRAIAVVFGSTNGHNVTDSFDVAESDSVAIESLVGRIMKELVGQKREVLLAALAEAGARLVSRPGKGSRK